MEDRKKTKKQLLNELLEVRRRVAELETIKANRQRIEGEVKYRTVFQSSPDSITITKVKDGCYLDVNKSFCKISGYQREEVLGKTPFDLNLFAHPDDRAKFIQILKEKGEVNDFELQYRVKDGTILDTLLSARPIQIGGEDCLVAVVRDITPLKKAEEEKIKLQSQLSQAQKMEAVGTLAGGIAHDFNNLLQTILGYADLLFMDKKKDDAGYRELQQIRQAVQRGAGLAHQLLTFSRKRISKRKIVYLNEEVMQIQKLIEKTLPKMIQIEFTLSRNLKMINADPAQVEQVLMNLVVNARDAIGESGKLIIGTQNRVLDAEYCKDHVGAIVGDYVVLEVSDTGQGMDQETLKRIFEPFYTTKEVGKGTGLGLSMVYGIVKAHEGFIECESEMGKGTVFKVYWPAIKERGVKEEVLGEEERPRGGTETILLIDDEESIRELGKETLSKFGYKVLTASDGESGLEVYRREGMRIDLIILDLMMPGVGGRRFLEEILKINPRVKGIIVSGYVMEDSIKNVLGAVAKSFISKPFEAVQILKLVRKVLDQ